MKKTEFTPEEVNVSPEWQEAFEQELIETFEDIDRRFDERMLNF